MLFSEELGMALEEGAAAYRRGSEAISRSILRDYGREASDPPKPKPRPEGWGNKAADRAEKWAVGYLGFVQKRGQKITVADLADGIEREAKVGRKIARAVAAKLLG